MDLFRHHLTCPDIFIVEMYTIFNLYHNVQIFEGHKSKVFMILFSRMLSQVFILLINGSIGLKFHESTVFREITSQKFVYIR